MRIGVDASRATLERRTGTEHYAWRLAWGLVEAAAGRGHDFVLYTRETPAPGRLPAGPAVQVRAIPWPRLWTHLRLSAELLLARPRPDVLFVPAHVLPLAHPVPTVVTVHDLGYRHFPAAHPLGQRLYLDWSTRFSARRATHLIADSLATRRDLARFYKVHEGRVSVVYPGRDETLQPTGPAAVRARYGLAGDYVLHVGTLQPRKNLLRLIDAVAAARQQAPGLSLVLAGRPGWLAGPILARARECAGFVRLLDYVPAADLAGLYSGARVFAFPSLYEGFGFPVLEAMACDTPVVCANAASLPELAGAAALLVDPADTAGLAGALVRAATDETLRAELVARGRAQVRRFSWARCAHETLAVLERAAQARGPQPVW